MSVSSCNTHAFHLGELSHACRLTFHISSFDWRGKVQAEISGMQARYGLQEAVDPNATIVDLGGNIGMVAIILWVLHHQRCPTIVSVEPVPETL